MKHFILIIATLLIPILAISQCYDVQQIPYSPISFQAGTDAQMGIDDAFSTVVDLGFEFCFFGDTVSRCVISPNGFISFDTSLANQFSNWHILDSIPTSSNSSALFSIMAPFQDLDPYAGGHIRYLTEGVAPNRKFVVSFDSIPLYGCTGSIFDPTVLRSSSQIVVYESLNIVDVNIAKREICSSWNEGLGIEGIQNQDGTEGYAVSGRNYPSLWTAQNDAFRFTPACECVEGAGIKDIATNSISLYPNPTTGELYIANSSPRNAIRDVEVLDTQGRMLLKEVGSGISKIDMGQLSTGIYLIRIETEKGSLVKRVVRN